MIVFLAATEKKVRSELGLVDFGRIAATVPSKDTDLGAIGIDRFRGDILQFDIVSKSV